MKRGYKYRIYPTEDQKKYIDLCIKGNVWFWNYALNKIEQHYKETKKHLSAYNDVARELPALKKDDKTSWLKQIASTSFIYTCKNIDQAWSAFFKGNADKPKKHKSCYGGSFTVQVQNNEFCNLKENYIFLQKATGYKLPFDNRIKTVFHRKIKGDIKSFTISKKSYDYYEVSILVNDEFVKPELEAPTFEGTIGIDLGVKSNVILSDGTKYDTVNVDKLVKKLKRLKRQLSGKTWFETDEIVYSKKYHREVNKKVPSKNYIKLKDKIAKLEDRIARIRSYHTHQITSSIVNNDAYNTICIEDLSVKDMLKNKKKNETENKQEENNEEKKFELKGKKKRKFHSNTSNANMGEIARQLVYKGEWNGKNVVKVNRYFASSQTCNCCGYKNKKVKDPSVRSWVCPVCGSKHDRDINAAINIRKEGYKIITE